jgi:uncharacterized membrane protein YfcA
MDGGLWDVIVFLTATFAAALVAGLAGFAFGLVAAAAWLHILTPLETAILIIGCGLIVQGMAVWKLRHALSWPRLWPFLIGAAMGVPIGAGLLIAIKPGHLRLAIGVILVLYALQGLARLPLRPVRAAATWIDIAVGVLNGIVGGMTGLAGIVMTIWCGIRGWPKDIQRAVFQPIGVATFAMSAVWLGAAGAVTTGVLTLFVLGLPFLLMGTWLGLKTYGRLSETAFRYIVLILLLMSGMALIVAQR